MKTFLEQNGYKMWEENTDYLGDKKFVTRKYQKRVDGCWFEKVVLWTMTTTLTTCLNVTTSRFLGSD